LEGTHARQVGLRMLMTKCMIYNTTGEPLDLVPALLGLCLHLRGKAVILETVPGRWCAARAWYFPCRPASCCGSTAG
jgi:hypothetical protein